MSKISKKDPKDILKEIKAEMTGISPDEITFSDFRDRKIKRKKKKKKLESESANDIIDNEEGFEVTNAGITSCNYGDIPEVRKKIKKKNSLEEWGAFDFFLYAQRKYIDKYTEVWDLNLGGSSLEVNKIRDKFYDLFGFCCNLIMRDYIDFFFENYMDYYVKHEGFYFRCMLSNKIMCEFYDGYNFPQRFEEYMSGEKQKKINFSLSKEEIREAFLIGDTSLISNYGIVISLNWLLIVRKMSPIDASKLIISACKDMHNRGMIEVVRKSTESYSPYPSNLAFTKPQTLMDKIDSNIKLEIEFNDTNNSQLQFLQKKGVK